VDGQVRGTGIDVRDSSGIRIVDNRLQDVPLANRRVSDRPVTRIGVVEGAPACTTPAARTS